MGYRPHLADKERKESTGSPTHALEAELRGKSWPSHSHTALSSPITAQLRAPPPLPHRGRALRLAGLSARKEPKEDTGLPCPYLVVAVGQARPQAAEVLTCHPWRPSHPCFHTAQVHVHCDCSSPWSSHMGTNSRGLWSLALDSGGPPPRPPGSLCPGVFPT